MISAATAPPITRTLLDGKDYTFRRMSLMDLSALEQWLKDRDGFKGGIDELMVALQSISVMKWIVHRMIDAEQLSLDEAAGLVAVGDLGDLVGSLIDAEDGESSDPSQAGEPSTG